MALPILATSCNRARNPARNSFNAIHLFNFSRLRPTAHHIVIDSYLCRYSSQHHSHTLVDILLDGEEPVDRVLDTVFKRDVYQGASVISDRSTLTTHALQARVNSHRMPSSFSALLASNLNTLPSAVSPGLPSAKRSLSSG